MFKDSAVQDVDLIALLLLWQVMAHFLDKDFKPFPLKLPLKIHFPTEGTPNEG